MANSARSSRSPKRAVIVGALVLGLSPIWAAPSWAGDGNPIAWSSLEPRPSPELYPSSVIRPAPPALMPEAPAAGLPHAGTPVRAVSNFDQGLSRAYLTWAAHLQDHGHWALAEDLRIKAFAAQRGDRPAPTPLLADGLGRHGSALERAATDLESMILMHGGWRDRPGRQNFDEGRYESPISAQALAQAQAAFDCWAGLVMDRGAPNAIALCRRAANTALSGLGAEAPGSRARSAI